MQMYCYYHKMVYIKNMHCICIALLIYYDRVFTMDHSIYAYLNRRSTQQLPELWYYYLGTDNEYDQTIFRMVTEILAKRGEFPTLYGENLF